MITPTIEEYLEAIYILQNEGSPVIGARVAERVGVSAPTMTDTLKRMAKQGYVTVDERREISLTETGREMAESLVRRHRLSERWLTDVLGLDWAKAHQEACKLEHAISPEVEKRLSSALANPSTCPHGNPIPGSGEVAGGTVPLSQVGGPVEVTVVRVSESAEEDIAFLDFLQRNGILPGAELTVVDTVPSAGVVTVTRGDHTVSMGMQAASRLWVQPKR